MAYGANGRRGRIFAALTLCAGLGAIARAELKNGLQIERSDRTGQISLVSTPDGQSLFAGNSANSQPATAAEALRELGPILRIARPDLELSLRRTDIDELGWTHFRYQQLHQGVPVFGAILHLHQNPVGEFARVNGDLYSIPDKLDIRPRISAAKAAAAAKRVPGFTNAEMRSSDLTIVDPGWYGNPVSGPKLAYYVRLVDLSANANEAFFVDALGGEILDHWSATCALMDRRIYNGNGSILLPGTLARSEGAAPVGVLDVDKAYDFASDTYHYYQRAFGRDSIDGAGRPITLTVNSTAPGCPNAQWNDQLLQAVFCANVVADDVVAHEITHGITQFSANLIYQNQSGQINESMSDIFGELVDLFNGNVAFAGDPSGPAWPESSPSGNGHDEPNNLRPLSSCSSGPGYANGVRWLIGEDASAFSAGVIRDMWSPTCRSHPDRTTSTFQTCSLLDAGGVHSGSGIGNHAFAMITDGKTFNGFTVSGIGPIKSGAVWYRALTVYLTPASDYGDLYAALNASAADLVGTFPNDPRTGAPSADMFTAADAVELNKALLAVEMNQQGNCGWTDDVVDPSPESLCADRTVVFSDDFDGGTNGWAVSNTAPPTPYDWVQVSDGLPVGRSGSAWFIADARIGNCSTQSEAAVHSLFSPTISISSGGVPMITFNQFMAVEGGWDGGNVKVRVNGGAWQLIPRTAFVHGPYNGRIRTQQQTNTNPLAGQAAFVGAGGSWGRCIIDLGAFAHAGDMLQVRFDFGKDCAFGFDGWYIANFELFLCPDCNEDGVADQRDQLFTSGSENLSNIGSGVPQEFVVASPPVAGGLVTLSVQGAGDFSSSSEYLTIVLNGSPVGSVFRSGGTDCPNTPDSETITLSASYFNTLVAGGPAVFQLLAPVDVDPLISQCKGATYTQIWVRYATVAAACPASTRLYVNAAASGAGTGANWDDAFTDLATAIASATCCNTEIWVAEGTYRPGPPGASRSSTFRMHNSLAIYGGFAGGESSLEERDPSAQPTILSGDLSGDDVGRFVNTTDNCYHVVTAGGTTASAVLDGFVIRSGNADGDQTGGPADSDKGGGIWCDGGRPTIANCVLEGNAAGAGGGCYFHNSNLVLAHCNFGQNQAAQDGGGLVVEGGNITLQDIVCDTNSAVGNGGAVALHAGALRVENCALLQNVAATGGGLDIESAGSALVSETLFFLNQAVGAGGGAFACNGGTAKTVSCRLLGNSADNNAGDGGGAVLLGGGDLIFADCLVSGNTTDASGPAAGGGAFHVNGGTTTISTCTVLGNEAPAGLGGGALLARNNAMQSIQIVNSILWFNVGGQITTEDPGVVVDVRYCDVQGGFAGVGNLNAEPLLVDADGADDVFGTLDDAPALSGLSPCIDAGSTSDVALDFADMDSDSDVAEEVPFDIIRMPRRGDDCGSADTGVGPAPLVDMGAYEYAGSAAPVIVTQPVGSALCVGQPLMLDAAASSSAAVMYQWRHDGADIESATSLTYFVASASDTDAGAYELVVTNLCGSATSESVAVVVSDAPSIVQQPVGATVCEGQPAEFSVSGDFPAGSTIQWRHDGEPIGGANSASFNIAATSVGDTGQYDVVISNGCGSAMSDAVTLIVQSAPTIGQQPLAPAVCAGGSVVLTVSAAGNPPPTYQWRWNGIPIAEGPPYAGVTTASLTIDPADVADAGAYDVLISNACDSMTSSAAAVVVDVPIEILQQPVGMTVCAGDEVQFVVGGTFSAGTAFQWRYNGTPIEGGNAAVLTISPAALANSGDFDVVISNSCNVVTSASATLVVHALPTITVQPVAVQACVGNGVTVSVTADSNPMPTYQWRRDGVPLSEGPPYAGVNSPTLIVDPMDAGDAGQYDIVVTNECGSVTSDAAAVVVDVPIEITQQPDDVSACTANPIELTVGGNFSPGTTFQWRDDGEPIDGATSATLTIGFAVPADAGHYDVVVANSCGTVVSNIATVVVNSAPSFSQQLTARFVCPGSTLILSAPATGSPSPVYEWRLNDVVLVDGGRFSGTGGPTLTISPFDATTVGMYAVSSSNVCGTAQSSAMVGVALRGDANCDGAINNFDIDFFVAGVLSPGQTSAPATYISAGGTQACWAARHCWGDLNLSGALNNFDIDPFVTCVLSPPPLGSPCP